MRIFRWVLLAIVTVASLWGGFAVNHDPAHEYWWDRIPFFFALFGFFGCLVIIFFSKSLGKLFLRKGDDYYDAD
jgi:hypothetical protein